MGAPNSVHHSVSTHPTNLANWLIRNLLRVPLKAIGNYSSKDEKLFFYQVPSKDMFNNYDDECYYHFP
jgi:hypothetical protein